MLDTQNLLNDLSRIYRPADVARWRTGSAAIHLALMHQPYFDNIVAEEKTIESRFATTRIAPIDAADAGDLIIFKLVGKPASAAAIIAKAVSRPLDKTAWRTIRAHRKAIGIDDTYLATKKDARFVALLWLSHVTPIAPVELTKTDRRGWVVVSARHAQIALL
jgi:hypothetical protein